MKRVVCSAMVGSSVLFSFLLTGCTSTAVKAKSELSMKQVFYANSGTNYLFTNKKQG